jgi:hypothetical protein
LAVVDFIVVLTGGTHTYRMLIGKAIIIIIAIDFSHAMI